MAKSIEIESGLKKRKEKKESLTDTKERIMYICHKCMYELCAWCGARTFLDNVA